MFETLRNIFFRKPDEVPGNKASKAYTGPLPPPPPVETLKSPLEKEKDLTGKIASPPPAPRSFSEVGPQPVNRDYTGKIDPPPAPPVT